MIQGLGNQNQQQGGLIDLSKQFNSEGTSTTTDTLKMPGNTFSEKILNYVKKLISQSGGGSASPITAGQKPGMSTDEAKKLYGVDPINGGMEAQGAGGASLFSNPGLYGGTDPINGGMGNIGAGQKMAGNIGNFLA